MCNRWQGPAGTKFHTHKLHLLFHLHCDQLVRTDINITLGGRIPKSSGAAKNFVWGRVYNQKNIVH